MADDVVIEYVGEVIRSQLSDKREMDYEASGTHQHPFHSRYLICCRET